ncbi:hypothetical protein N7539_001586 [Penicillium diatomitis]|uniref:Thiaminase-2/PQQC domain-containing protein n=1 Tax=Penicillium diatomitis TaxID=2819901 RepID=A0A9W9XHQ6_9EURO|nr:uncharacterized protein N7539_001586 [Penicillium diatomitis]KAJ5492840.1 hypothetical protein N7539_001586 [Penicillium diatomitis]
MTTTQGPLTQWLLEATPQSLKRATTHPFLAAAGCGTVSKEKLSQWLSQDRLYAQSYIRFIGLLLAKIRIPENESMATMTTITAHSPGTSVEQRIIDVLIDALVNIRTELHFFKETAAEYGLDLTALPPREGYKDPESDADRPGSTNASASTAQSVPIATSAGILTTGPRSACPGFTGRICQGTNVSVGDAESGEIEDDGGPVNLQSRDAQSQLHRLCKVQGECKAPSGAGPCHLASSTSTSTSQSPSWLSVGAGPAVTTPDCEPCQPSRSTTTEVSSEQGPVFFCANPITRAYIDMFMSVASPGVSAIEGITVLWATEICYLRAWRYAASYGRKKALETETVTSVQAARIDGSVDADGGALRDRFIPNWSSEEFEEFVNRIGRVLDQMVDSFKGAEEAEMIRAKCLEWWRQVVWLEERFWPSME